MFVRSHLYASGMKLTRLIALLLAIPLLLTVAPSQQAAAETGGLTGVTAYTAGSKRVGDKTSVWGTVSGPNAAHSDVWVEVQLPSGAWSKSRSDWTDGKGAYAIELTYGATTAGTYRYRVVAYDWHSGVRVTSRVVTLTRTPWRVSTAGTKRVRLGTSAWGKTPGEFSYAAVTLEVLVGGRWVKSQVGYSQPHSFTLPLKYGSHRAGTYTFRVVADNYAQKVVSQPFSLRRTAHVTASHAGTKRIGQATNTWGYVRGVPKGRAWTEVLVRGRWSRSQTVTTDSNGRFVIPLTYGRTTVGRHTFRVGGTSPHGNVYSPSFTVTRTR